MSRRPKHTEHVNHERWLVSYADFITLLFAFFVVMFASGQTDHQKAKQVSDSVRKSLEEGPVQSAIASMMSGNGGVQRVAKPLVGNHETPATKVGFPKKTDVADPALENTYLHLLDALKHEIQNGEMKVTLEPRGLVISLRQAAFFPSGGDSISQNMAPTIEKIALAIGKVGNPVRLEGHTDSIPIHSPRFQSNWELSAARSIAMLTALTDRLSDHHPRFAIAGYADSVPIDSNDTEEGRAHNRRVDVVILRTSEMRDEPQGGK